MVWLAVTIATASSSQAATAAPAPPPPETIAARQLFFGAENVDPITGAVDAGEVHLSWVSVATFAVAIDGHVLLFDAYIHKEEDRPNYVPATTDDLVALRPEAILIGHGHFDHALEAGRIARETGAVIVGTQQHCDEAEQRAGADLDCIVLFDGSSTPGEVRDFALWDGVCTTAVLHLHSAATPPDPDHDHTDPVIPIPDPGSILLHPPGSLFGTEGEEGGTVLYLLRVGDFTLAYHDSSGPLVDEAPEVLDVLAGLPRPDVQVGAILGFNQITNGLRDPATYIDALDPQVFIPNHHDFVTEYGSGDDFEPVLERELERYDTDPEVRFIYDPYDYVRPNLLSFRIDDQRWADPEGVACPSAAPAAPPEDVSGSTSKAPLPTTGAVLIPALLLAALLLAAHRRRG